MEPTGSHGMSAESGKGPLGLTTLSQPTSLPLADIIFVHGLGGGSRKTWSYSTDPEHFWPREWLAKDPDFTNVGIHSFGYAADWAKTEKNIYRITDFAHSLLSHISNHPAIGQTSNGIILCGHSLGGCVAKMAYILAGQNPAKADISRRISSMIFLGTPHRGSDLAKILAGVLSVSLGSKPFVKSLTLDSAELEDINDRFREHVGSVRLWSFYETLPIKKFGLGYIVVKPHSATLGFPGEEATPLHADHRQICKFKSSDDPNYRAIRNTILTAVDYAQSQQRQNRGVRLRRFLQIQSVPEDDFHTLRGLKQPGSCEWLLRRKEFTSWAAGSAERPPIFWLTAMPGSGKSVLSSHVLDALDSWSQTLCSGFTFQNARSGNAAFSECLRSLAYQMAQVDPEALKRLVRLEEEAAPWNMQDEVHAWRKLFVENIFGIPSLSRHVWVIDGLDECANLSAAFTKLLSNAPSTLRIFITSRSVEAVNRGIRALESRVSRYQLTLEDTAEDIAAVVMAGLDALDIVEEEDEKASICETIIRRSRGMFLWVRLVLQELESAAIWSTEHIHSTLSEIPDGLSQLYAKCLKSALGDKRSLKLIRPILSWATLGSRALTAKEIRSAVKLDAHEALLNAENAIPSICAQLLFVDKGKMVRAIHETFHEFLLSEDCPHAIRIDKPRSHARVATLLLQHLAGDHMRPVIHQDSKYILQGFQGKADMTLVDYAARHFSDHLYESDPSDGELLSSLCRFLEGDGVLAWMALSAADRDTRRLAKVADRFEQYLHRRKHVLGADTDPKHDLIRNWATDLFRFSCKFGPQLADSPGSFFDLIPSLCPSGTVIAKAFRRFVPSSTYRALRSAPLTWWDPVLASRECDGTMSTTAHGCNHFAAVRGELVGIYDQRSTQWLLDIPLPAQDQVKPFQGVHEVSLAFSPRDEYLAIHHQHNLSVFELLTGALLQRYHLEEETEFEAGSRSHFAFASKDETGLESGSSACLAFPASDRLVLLTAKRITRVSWEGRPGNHDTIHHSQLPTKDSPEIPPSQWWTKLATDGDRSIVVFGVRPNSESVMLWDSEKDEIIAEYRFSPWKPGGDPKPVRTPSSRSTSQPIWPPKNVASRSRKGDPGVTRPGNLSAWISPSLALPVLVFIWVYDGKFKHSIVDYSRDVIYDLPPQPWCPRPLGVHVVSASFSGDGSIFTFLQQDLIYAHIFSVDSDGRVSGTTTYIPMDDIYDELVPTFANGLRLQLNFDGLRFMLISPSTLSALVLYARGDDRKVHEEHRGRDFYKREMKQERLTGPPPAKDEHRDTWLAGSEDEVRITLLSPRSLTAVRVWQHDRHPPGKLNSSARICTELVMNDGRTRAAWECNWFIGDEQRTELIVADLSWPPAQEKGAVDEQNLPAFNAVLHQPVDSRCLSLLLNESGDRLIRRIKNDCELWELPSWRRLGRWNLWQFWPRRAGLEEQRGAVWLPLVQHTTDPEWLLCVNVFAPRSVAMLSWRDFTLSMGVGDGEPEVVPCPDSAEPPAGQPPGRQPSRPNQLEALLRGLELLVPEVVWAYNDTILLWKECFAQYTMLCAARDPCSRTVHRFFNDRGFLPIAFLATSRTLVFLGSDTWIYSTQIGDHIPAAASGDARGSLPTRAPWTPGPGASPPPCPACNGSHPLRALRHLHAGFAHNERWRCAWAGGGAAPGGRRRMDFSFWGAEPTDRIIVRDALRYADEVEWVEHRNEDGRVWKSGWRLVEEGSGDGEMRTGRVV